MVFLLAICNFWHETVCEVCELAFLVVKIVHVDPGEDLFPADPV